MGAALNKEHGRELTERLSARLIATAPADDEPLIEEDRQALERSESWFRDRGGKGIPVEEILSDFGLRMDDFPEDRATDRHEARI